MKYRLWKRSRIAWSDGWQDSGQVFDHKNAGYEEKSFTEYLMLPEGTRPVDMDADAFRVAQVKVPEGGFLAVIVKGSLPAPVCSRFESALNTFVKDKAMPFPVVVINADCELVAVGAEEGIA